MPIILRRFEHDGKATVEPKLHYKDPETYHWVQKHAVIDPTGWEEKGRNRGIGASEIAILCGMSGRTTPFDMWALKTGKVDPPDEKDSDANEYFYWGHAHEPIIGARYARDHDSVELWGRVMLMSRSEEIFRCTPDGIQMPEPLGLEIKTAGFRQRKKWGAAEDAVPVEYLMQSQWCMGVTGLARWDLAVLIGGNEYRCYELTRDDAMISMMQDEAVNWWKKYVMADKPPKPIAGATAKDYFKKRFPKQTSAVREITGEEIAMVEKMLQVRDDFDQVEKLKEAAENEVKALIGDSEGIEAPFARVLWKAIKDTAKTDWEAVAKEMGATPDQIAKFTRVVKGYRRLTVISKENEE